MSSCHAIVNINGEPSGDFMDVEMFNFTRWKIYELNAIEYRKYAKPAVSPLAPVSGNLDLNVPAGSDYSSTLRWLFSNDFYPSLMVSPYFMQIINIKTLGDEGSFVHQKNFVTDSSQLRHQVDSNYTPSDTDYSSDNLCAILSRVELLSVRSFEFSSESRRMSVVVKRSTLGQCLRQEEFLMGMNVDEVKRKGCIDIDPSIIYNGSNESEGFERAMEPELEIYVKGAPENVRNLCDPASIPCDFEEKLMYYSRSGCRVIACAYKKLGSLTVSQVYKISQVELEENAKFAGFIVFENKLKPSSKSTCSKLDASKIEMFMCSGDNLLTSISVARKCCVVKPGTAVFVPHFTEVNVGGIKKKDVIWKEIDDSNIRLNPSTLVPSLCRNDEMRVITTKCSITSSNNLLVSNDRRVELKNISNTLTSRTRFTHGSHTSRALTSLKRNDSTLLHDYCLAITGDIFEWIQENAPMEIIDRMLLKTKVYARMLPQQKLSLVEHQKARGHTVLFVGDGANDIAALRAANVGLSVSGAESSMAAPFVSKDGSLHKTLDIILCGRSALVTSFCCFKYMAIYSLIQLTTILILYTEHMNLTDPQLIGIDLGMVFPLTLTISLFHPSKYLGRKRPTLSLVNTRTMTSLILQALLQLFTQCTHYLLLTKLPSYVRPPQDEWRSAPTYIQSALFLSSLPIYFVNAIVCCAGGPHRQSLYKNFTFFALVCIYTILVISFIVFSINPLITQGLFESVPLNTDSRFIVAIISILCVSFSLITDKLLANPIADMISKYVRRASTLKYVFREKFACSGNENGFFNSILSNLCAAIVAIPPCSLKRYDGSALFRARSEYHRNHNKKYMVCKENMQKDIDLEHIKLNL